MSVLLTCHCRCSKSTVIVVSGTYSSMLSIIQRSDPLPSFALCRRLHCYRNRTHLPMHRSRRYSSTPDQPLYWLSDHMVPLFAPLAQDQSPTLLPSSMSDAWSRTMWYEWLFAWDESSFSQRPSRFHCCSLSEAAGCSLPGSHYRSTSRGDWHFGTSFFGRTHCSSSETQRHSS